MPQMMLIHDDDVVETFATNRADNALHVNILPRRLPCGYDFLNRQFSHAVTKTLAIKRIAISQEISGYWPAPGFVDTRLS